jgi:hypothetical protein
LKSLDSDERIQGNPRKSKEIQVLFSGRPGQNRDGPRKPKSIEQAGGPRGQ